MITDPVPDLVGAVAASGAGADCSVVGNQVRCTIAELAPGQIVTIDVTGTLPTSAAGTLVNGVTVAAQTPDPDPANNSTEVSAPVQAAPPAPPVPPDKPSPTPDKPSPRPTKLPATGGGEAVGAWLVLAGLGAAGLGVWRRRG